MHAADTVSRCMPMDIVTRRDKERRRCNGADGEQLPQLLDSPLPTPRRSCASADAASVRCRREASPLRTQVPFSWESSPGVPKRSSACMHRAQESMPPPPKPPPGRWPPYPARNWCGYGNSSDASSEDDDASFSDALDRISTPDQRVGSFDRIMSKRFEDIFLDRATSFVNDRSSRHSPAAASLATPSSSSGRGPKHWRRRSTRRDHDGQQPTARQSNDHPVQVQLLPRININGRDEQMSPRACGLMLLFPWSAKPAACGFRRPPAQYAPSPLASASKPSPSQSRRFITLRDAMQEENKTGSAGGRDLPRPRGEKRSREEWQASHGWGVSSLLDASKKYCTDARKALSKLSIGLGTDSGSGSGSGSPRVSSRERKSGKQDTSSTMPAMAAKLTQLKTSRN